VKRLLILVFLVAFLLAPAAQAHDYIRTTEATRYYERKMEIRINNYRLSIGRFLALHAFNLHLAGVTLSHANYEEARYTTEISGVPWGIWNDQFLTPTQQVFNAMMTRRRCYGYPLTPYQVLEGWKRRSGYRFALLNPLTHTLGVRVVYLHRHAGDWAGKGRCTVYYVAVAS
jgi:hypothetical protein